MQDLIEKYKLQPHPEGGYFREVFRSDMTLASPAANQKRNAVTHIYYLLVAGQVSRFHKVVHDEIWNFYQGSPVKLLKYDTQTLEQDIIGPGCDDFVCIVKGGFFQAAEPTGEYSLVGCTVAPGFDFADFSFLKDHLELAAVFQTTYPDLAKYL
ncbi:MAG: cupin domain-containing protein [Desulfobacteraceae bacterium]|nr:cupin domain-containing protein [Desulfobacteraceae bacterium]